MIRSPEVGALLVALLFTAIVTPLAARLQRKLFTRRPAGNRGEPRRPRSGRLLAATRRTTTRLSRAGRRSPSADAVAAWCDGMARQIRAGSTIRDALATTNTSSVALSTALDEIQHDLGRGESIEAALDRHGLSGGHLGLACAVIAASARLGGPSSRPLDRAAAALRLRAADEQERVAHSAQARMSAHVLTLVPLGFLGLMLTLDDGVRTAATTPAGAAIIGAGLLLNGLGWLWMHTVIERGAG
jgi:Flp pilus assembly protein TadB